MRIRSFAVLAAAAPVAVGLLVTGAIASGDHHAQRTARAGSHPDNRALFAVLTGRKEVGPDNRRGAGDPDGRGTFTAIVDDGQLCFGSRSRTSTSRSRRTSTRRGRTAPVPSSCR
jgi:hypothetical protein